MFAQGFEEGNTTGALSFSGYRSDAATSVPGTTGVYGGFLLFCFVLLFNSSATSPSFSKAKLKRHHVPLVSPTCLVSVSINLNSIQTIMNVFISPLSLDVFVS